MINKPPFELNNEMLNIVASITEKVGRIEESKKIENNLYLRKQNRIKTIKATTAIENNTLSLKQVADVINGKVVIGKQKEIKEVKNAFRAYENICNYDPFEINSFLIAHSYITESLVETPGKLRTGDVAIYEGEKVVHVGARAEYVYDLVENLFKWAKATDTHPLIVSSVVHYEIETIHPFEDGNGRIGRLWQTMILSSWRNIFENIPIETIVYKYQNEYYKAIEKSRTENLANRFILFMLNAIDETLNEVEDVEITDIITDIITDKLSKTELTVLTPKVKYLLKQETIDNSKAQALTNKGVESVKKYLNKFTKLNILILIGQNKGRKYRLNREVLVEYNKEKK